MKSTYLGGYMMQDKDHVVRRGLKIILKSVGSKVSKLNLYGIKILIS